MQFLNLGVQRRSQDLRKYLRWKALQQQLTAKNRKLLLKAFYLRYLLGLSLQLRCFCATHFASLILSF